MAKKKTTTEKEINYRLEEQFSRVERMGWVVLMLSLLASILGLLGSGPLSSIKKTAGTTSIQFDRFSHILTPTEITIDTKSETSSIKIAKEYLKNYTIDAIVPNPLQVTEEEKIIVYDFGNKRPTATFQLTPKRAGLITGRLQQVKIR